MSNGIVVDHKENGRRYAISEKNFNPKIHDKVRELKPGETILGFKPKAKGALVEDAPAVEDYTDKNWTVDALLAEIASRNEQLEEDEQIVPDSSKKADLIAALLLDDEALAEAEIEDDSTPE